MNLGSLAEDWSARASRITNHVKGVSPMMKKRSHEGRMREWIFLATLEGDDHSIVDGVMGMLAA